MTSQSTRAAIWRFRVASRVRGCPLQQSGLNRWQAEVDPAPHLEMWNPTGASFGLQPTDGQVEFRCNSGW